MEDLEEHIIYDNGQEVKAWAAIARYVESMGESGGEISEYYSQAQGRKVIDDDASVGAFLKNPNKIALAMVGILVGVIAVLVLLIIVIVKLVKRRRRRNRR